MTDSRLAALAAWLVKRGRPATRTASTAVQVVRLGRPDTRAAAVSVMAVRKLGGIVPARAAAVNVMVVRRATGGAASTSVSAAAVSTMAVRRMLAPEPLVLRYFDGTTTRSAHVLGVWDGAAIQPLSSLGRTDAAGNVTEFHGG